MVKLILSDYDKMDTSKILLEKRMAFTPAVREIMDILTLDAGPVIVGSYKYVIHEYPVDIDMFEETRLSDVSERIVCRKIARRFKVIAQKIRKRRLTYLADFKAGEDDRFVCPYIGSFDVSDASPVGYEPDRIREWIRNADISDRERKIWFKKVVDNPDYPQYIALYDLLHDRRVVRWSLSEIEKGRKILTGGRLYTLEEAVASRSVVKMDLWAWIDHRFVEISNWYRIRFRKIPGGRWIDLTKTLPVYEDSLRRNIREYFTPRFKKNFKMAKRVWMYAAHTNDIPLMKLLFPLFRSDASRLGQMKGEIDVIVAMIDRLADPPLAHIRDQVDHFNEVISTITQNVISSREKKKIFCQIGRIDTDTSIPALRDVLLSISEVIEKYIQRYVYAFLKQRNIFTILASLLLVLSPSSKPIGRILTYG